MLTGNKDLNFEILNNLSDKDLLNFCQTNTQAYALCNDETFWQRRTIKNYGKYISVDTMKKFKKNKWSTYYIELGEKTKKHPAYNLAKAIEEGRTDVETILRKKYPNIDVRYIKDGAGEYYYDVNEPNFVPIPQGKYKIFYANGKIKKEGNYLDGIRIGEWKTYYSSGNLETVSYYKKNNKFDLLDGEQVKYYPNGKVELYEYWENGSLLEKIEM